jgi:hypothetical protein
MNLLGKHQNALSSLNLVMRRTYVHAHASFQYRNQFKGMMNVRGKGEIFTRLLAKIFRNAEMLVLIDHIAPQK